MKSRDQVLLEKAYNIINEAQLPSARFRNRSYSENHKFYRLYVKLIKEANQPFRWAGEFSSKEDAMEAFNSGHNLGAYKPVDYQYVIKEVSFSYSEKTIDKSPILKLVDEFPEVKGTFGS